MAEIIVMLAPGADSRAVAGRLARHGFLLQADLGELGMLTGEAEEAAIPALRSEEGVARVDLGHGVHIATDPGATDPGATDAGATDPGAGDLER
jgi:hypothetical protein